MALLFTCVFLRCSNSSQTWRSRERTAGSTNTAPGSRTSTPSCMRSENILCVPRACHVYPFSKAQPQFGLYFHQTLKYLSKTPCSRQSPEIVKEFLTTMVPHKLTKSVRSGHHSNFQPWCFQYNFTDSIRCTALFRWELFFLPNRAEKLQLLNHRPLTAVEIQLVSVFKLNCIFISTVFLLHYYLLHCSHLIRNDSVLSEWLKE